MNLDPQDLPTPSLATTDDQSSGCRVPESDRPEVVTHGDGRVLFGPGLDDFNAFDDPC